MTLVNEVCNWHLLKMIKGNITLKKKVFSQLYLVIEIISFPDAFPFRKNNNENIPTSNWNLSQWILYSFEKSQGFHQSTTDDTKT